MQLALRMCMVVAQQNHETLDARCNDYMISESQRFPIYIAASLVVLFAILLFSGLGSHLSGRFPDDALPRALRRAILLVVALIAAAVMLLSPLFYGLVHLAAPWRVVITVGALAPLGLALGMPMPTAIRILDRQAPELVPWAWGVNGAASVLGSVGAIALAMVWGFDQALLVGAGIYLIGLGCVTWAVRADA